jgi:hypothetical protein
MENDEISYASVSKWLKIKHLVLVDGKPVTVERCFTEKSPNQ